MARASSCSSAQLTRVSSSPATKVMRPARPPVAPAAASMRAASVGSGDGTNGDDGVGMVIGPPSHRARYATVMLRRRTRSDDDVDQLGRLHDDPPGRALEEALHLG